MITIDQLLESVDLDFEPRWVTKDEDGVVCIYSDKPRLFVTGKLWQCVDGVCHNIGRFKLSEFEGKNTEECIYEVPRKTDEYEQNLEKLRPADSDLVYRVHLPRKTTGKIYKFDSSAIDTLHDSNPEKFKKFICGEIVCKLNEVIDAVNELKGAKNG